MNKEIVDVKRKAAISNETEGQWDALKKARNRINSQRTRERERVQIETLEAEKTRLWLSNDALKYQNKHMREAIAQIRELHSDPTLRQSLQNRASTEQSSPQINLSSFRGNQRQSLMLDSGGPSSLSSVGVPANLASLMVGNDANAQSLLSAHTGLGLQPMMQRGLGIPTSSRVSHPLLLNSAQLQASSLFQTDRSHQMVTRPNTDFSIFGSAGLPQLSNSSHADAIGGAFNNAMESSTQDDPFSERKLDGLGASFDSIRKRQRNNNFGL